MGQYNDAEGAARLIAEHADALAAVIVEPLQGSARLHPGRARASWRRCATRPPSTASLLVFDEVMTSRLSPGGLQQAIGVTPDLTTLGKYLGGGLTFGAFGGRADLMARFDPTRADALPARRHVQQQRADDGGRPGRADADLHAGRGRGAERARRPAARAPHGRRRGPRPAVLRERLRLDGRPPLRQRAAALRRPTSPATRPKLAGLRALLHLHCLEHGCSYGRRGFMALSLPLTTEDHDRLVQAVETFLDERGELVRLAA